MLKMKIYTLIKQKMRIKFSKASFTKLSGNCRGSMRIVRKTFINYSTKLNKIRKSKNANTNKMIRRNHQ